MKNVKPLRAIDIAYIAIFTALTAICAWLTIPLIVPFTMQTFAVVLAANLLGLRRGTISVALYLLLGALGVPVFSGFNGGIGVLAGPTGGYLIGFLFTVPAVYGVKRLLGDSFWATVAAMAVGILVCYAFGTAWFSVVYTRNVGEMSLGAILMKCVVPFLIPDAAKIALAAGLSAKLKKRMKL